MRRITPEDKQAAARLKKLWNEKKEALSLTQEKAAEELGFNTQGAVSQYLNGKVPLNTDTIIKFAKILHVSPEAIKPELSSLLKYVRETDSDSNTPTQQPEISITNRELALLKLINQLPESEQTSLHESLQEKKRYYDRLFEEIAKAKGLKVG
ncbi:helix-turn-helix domain-containing protein [Arsenophonus nasoniae]|uniref:Helix-turn-helix domain-containing protein n=1 Tax=Arsenophonus nasoniae TaxID=638 RepID=D2U4K8_9GAMM|nr:helix-turn-helix domain-containing protein [Arsenophonus nasoniae]QBY45394.1 helix-turn-helix protein [Arsenophonus nasoniae]WGM05543.1 helix-turn-helix domain-containing protein [Arsenophonus nasoniae]WGM10556.1 helix-turn-helix domain-containing protein [Arsenophonus nasoniae]WGM15262.1 helix-turn-helix domain-containing protein [Arsenophonus nasoniae]CBA76565.1 phage transcriptional regulator [Arsenophonus nasoniae]